MLISFITEVSRSQQEFLRSLIKSLVGRCIISMEKDKILVWSTVKCKEEKIHQEISWRFGASSFHLLAVSDLRTFFP